MSIHHLKIQRKPFEDLVSGRKTGEVRNCADREFREGDQVELFLLDETGNPANKSIVRTITHIQRGYGLPDDICVLSYAAPVVERQPVAFSWVVVSPDGKEFSELQSSEDAAKDLAHDMDGDLHPDHTGGRHEIKAVYTAPPELAELQATIVQLKDEVGEAKGEYDRSANKVAQLTADLTEEKKWRESAEGGWRGANKVITMQREKLDSLEAENERLKGGQGEPFGWFTDDHVDDKSATTYTPAVAERWRAKGWPVTPLYTSQPAPVSLPDGWKLVPEVATLEMKNAGWQECERQGVDPESIEMQTVWTAIHLSAPASTRSRS